jgi:FAD/FMN-containing dehydrogenase
LTCDRLLAAEVVLADGRIVRCDSHRQNDLFWALRGAGGGHVGIVTCFVFDPVPEPEVTVFRLHWPPAGAVDLVAAWMEWAPAVDDRLTAHLELSVPGDPAEPPNVWLVGTMVADPASTRAVLELGTRLATEPLSATFDQFRYAQAKALLGEDPPDEDRLLEFHRSEFFDGPLSRTGVTALVGHLVQARSSGQTRTVSFLPMGGAYNRVPAEATAFAHRHHRFLIEHIAGVRPTAAAAEQQAAADWSAASWRLVHPEAAHAVYPNFPDADLTRWAKAYWGTNHARLRQIKRRYDPGNLFWARQGLHTDQAEELPA